MDEIQQEIRKIMVSINRIDGIYYQWAKRIGLKDNMLALLYALSDGNLHSQKQISEEWLIPKTTINTVIQECIQKDYVVLQQEPHSKEKRICLTEAGKQYAEVVLKDLRQAELQAYMQTRKVHSEAFAAVFEEFAFQLQKAYEDFEHKI